MPSVSIEDTTSESALIVVRTPLLSTDRVFLTVGSVTYKGTLADILVFIADNFDLSAYVTTESIVNVLTSTSATVPASAGTVKALKDLIDTINTSLADKCPLVEGKVPSANLPSYIDDTLEYANLAAFPMTGESGKIYIASNTNFIYRWTGSAYVLIGDGTSVDVVTVGANAFPRYDASQSLSTAQKAQLATNIGVFNPTINTQTGTSYTLGTVTTDNDGKTYLRMANASANTALVTTAQTLPISVRQAGAGTTTLVADAGVTLNGTLAFTAQHQTKTIVPVSAGVYDVVG